MNILINMRCTFSIMVASGLIMFSGCSHKKTDEPVGPPPTPSSGRVSLFNNSEVSVMVAGYTQLRGSESRQVRLYVHLFPGNVFYLHNLIEPDEGQLFPGGDKLAIVYVADASDPSNPWQPLFQGTVELVVDGNLTVQIKSGGEYGISPG
jgi:hypothetical protein